VEGNFGVSGVAMQSSGISSVCGDFVARGVVVGLLGLLVFTGCASRGGGGGGGFGNGNDNNNDAGDAGVTCGDGTCTASAGESCSSCAEDCDCGETVCGDGTCDLENGETCASCDDDCGTLPQCQAGACGDGVIATDEMCDDNNFNSFDGCSALCVPEPGYACDGQPSACGRAPVAKGEIIVTEVLPNPAGIDDTVGEWIEVYNTTGDTINLENVVVSNEASQTFTVWAVILLEPGEYAVLAAEADAALNGGVAADFEYVGFTLADTLGSVTLKVGTTTLDTATYGNGTAVPAAGRSLRLDPSAFDVDANDAWESWCTGGGSAFGTSGDFGSPGDENEACPPPPTPLDFTTSPAATVVDNTKPGTTTDLAVSAPECSILYMDVDVNISHTWTGDLRVTLKNPAGTAVQLHARTGGSADNLIGNYPNTLNVATNNSLGTFAGTDPNGTWQLTVADEAGGGETGTVNSWGLHIYCVQ
jgi:cysteine-rich repeat protein